MTDLMDKEKGLITSEIAEVKTGGTCKNDQQIPLNCEKV